MITTFGLLGKLDSGVQVMAKPMFNNMASRFGEKVVETKTIKEWLWGSVSKTLEFVLSLPPSLTGGLSGEATVFWFEL